MMATRTPVSVGEILTQEFLTPFGFTRDQPAESAKAPIFG
jgi:plasmid maintenance system antidote protein VapI